jgi:hypothetical protein
MTFSVFNINLELALVLQTWKTDVTQRGGINAMELPALSVDLT